MRILFCWFLGLLGVVQGSEILGVFPHSGLTHWLCFKPVMEELARRGHQVTVLSLFPRETPLQNYVDVSLKPSYDVAPERAASIQDVVPHSMWEMVELYELATLAENTLRQEDVLALVNRTFDVVIMEFFHTDVYHALAHNIRAPVVGISSHQITEWSSETMRNPAEPSYVTFTYSPTKAPFSFAGRVLNTLVLHAVQFVYKYFHTRKAHNTAESLLGEIPELEDLARNTTLLLVNSHFTVTGSQPRNPNVIEIGGINVLQANPLPKDLQVLMDESTDGVIYFSMGTLLKPSTLPETKRNAFVRTFASLKQTVLWKWDGTMNDIPDNVHIRPWLPQRDIFAHKNVVLFISHCGNLGLNEAVHEGIPILCIPMFGDQPLNSKSVESQGMAVTLDFFNDLTYEKVKSTVNRLLTDPKYKRNAQRVSKAYRDRPMTPLQTAIYWIEYVLRHEGAYHMRSPARNMAWYQYHNVDVFFILQLVALAVVYSLYQFLRGLVKCLKRLSFQATPSQSTTKVKKS